MTDHFYTIIRLSCASIFFVFTAANINAQHLSAQDYAASQNPKNFHELQKAVNEYYAQYPGLKGEKVWRRTEWYLEQRLYPSGEFVDMETITRKEYKKLRKSDQRSTHGGWLFVGPTNWTSAGYAGGNYGQGRVNSVDIHPTDTNTIYITTPNSGIWKTTNGGLSWTNISPHLPHISAIDLEIDPTNPNVLYALTGDGENGWSESSAHIHRGVKTRGIIKSTDGGQSWFQTDFINDHPEVPYPLKLLMHPTDPLTQYASFTTGMYFTTDGWNSSTQKLFGSVFDIEFHPTNPNIIYACSQTQFARSVNGGQNWIVQNDSDFSILPGTSRLEIAVTPDIPNMVYLIGTGWDSISRVSLFQSLDSGASGSWFVRDTVSDLIGPMGRYSIAMAVRPDDFQTVIAGGINYARSTSQGAPGSWTFVGFTYPSHPDVHELKYRGNTLYSATDGGLHKSYDDGQTWIDLSPGIANTEIYRISGTPQNTSKYIIGAQDVGTKMKTSVSSTFAQIGGADGMISYIDPTNQNKMYISGQTGGIARSTNGGTSFTSITPPGNGGAWITPYVMDPVDSDILFVGKDSIHRSFTSGNTWQLIPSPSPFNLNGMTQGINNRNKMYISRSSKIWRSDNVLDIFFPVAWTEITAGLPNLFITDIAVDPGNANVVYVTVSGFSSGQKVYKNDTGNANDWVNISGSLPNVPANCIAFHDNGQDGLYVGTDIGVFYRDNTLSDWIYFSNRLPSTTVNDLYINPTNNTIAAGTYGNGLWLSSTYSACVANLSITGASTNGGTLYYSASNSITSSNDYRLDIVSDVHYQAGNYIDLKDGFEHGGVGFFEGKMGGCPTDFNPPMSSTIFNFSTFLEEGQVISHRPESDR